MKVNMDYTLEKKQADLSAEPEEAVNEENLTADRDDNENSNEKASSASDGNVYLAALKEYWDKMQKEAKSKGFFRSTKFWIILIIVLFILFISANNKMSGQRTRLQSQIRHTNTEISKLNTAVDDLKIEMEEQAKIDALTLSNEEEDLARNDAKVQGAKVADLQNEYLSIDEEYIPQIMEIESALQELNKKEEDSEIRQKKGELEQQEKELDTAKYNEITEVKGKLDPYFDDNGKRAGKGSWYGYNVNGIPGKWEFATNATFKGNTTRVLWLCYSDDRQLLAYATSRYNADTKLFSDVSIMLTSYAEANINSDDDMLKGSTEELSVTEQLQKLAESGDVTINTPPADEEFDQETIDMNNDVVGAREEYKQKVANGEVEGEEFSTDYITGLQGYGSNAADSN